jgi:hypothetical protein
MVPVMVLGAMWADIGTVSELHHLQEEVDYE